MRRCNRACALLAGALLMLAGCGAPAETAAAARPELGLMTSLPLYWQADAAMADIAAGRSPLPWQRQLIETRHVLVPLDTLSAIPALAPNAPETDPLAGITRLAVIQPRGLSPADNVALDDWVRAGGRLLLALDPALTGGYDLPLGDPRRPVDSALIPPVVERWGLAIRFDEAQPLAVIAAPFAGDEIPLALPGRIAIADPARADCVLAAQDAIATCRVGKGQVTLIADAALFEHAELAGEDGAALARLLGAAFDRAPSREITG
ncbi:MAG: GldG family protein [Erythrobacteraceae bacterium]|jgi:hypothetical protein|nr:GldG family protein [Erythrobacteraceae bacterium]